MLKQTIKKLPLAKKFIRLIKGQPETEQVIKESPPTPETPESILIAQAQVFLTTGNQLLQEKKFDQAITCYQEAIMLNPEYADAYYFQGIALAGLEKIEEALATYEMAVKLRPNWSQVYLDLGNVLMQQGKIREALKYYDEAIKHEPEFSGAYFYRGNAQQNRGNYRQAVEDYHRAISLGLDSEDIFINLSVSIINCGKQLNQQKLSQSLKVLGTAISCHENSPWLYIGLGHIASLQNQPEKTVFYFEKASQLALDSREIQMTLGHLSLKQYQLERSWKHYQQVIRLENDNIEAYNEAGVALFLQGKMEEAVTPWAQGIKVKKALAQSLKLEELGIRFLGKSWLLAIGHIAFLDIYIKMGLMGWHSHSKNYLVMPSDLSIPNRPYLDYWSDYINLIDDVSEAPINSENIEYITDEFWAMTLPQEITKNYYRVASEVQKEWEAETRPPLLKLSAQDTERGWNCLEKLGMPKDAWFVCLHVRESGFHQEWNQIYAATRDANIETYNLAIQSIVEQGGWVVRVGDSSMKPLAKIPQVIDYAHSDLKTDWMDIFLCAKCRFFMGTNSGLALVPPTFGVPCVLTNWNPLGVRPHYGQDIFIPKLYWLESEKRYLSFSETTSPPVGYSQFIKDFEALELRVIDNDAEDLQAVVVEMLERQSDRFQYSTIAQTLQKQFEQVTLQAGGYSGSPIGQQFLFKYKHLL